MQSHFFTQETFTLKWLWNLPFNTIPPLLLYTGIAHNTVCGAITVPDGFGSQMVTCQEVILGRYITLQKTQLDKNGIGHWDVAEVYVNVRPLPPKTAWTARGTPGYDAQTAAPSNAVDRSATSQSLWHAQDAAGNLQYNKYFSKLCLPITLEIAGPHRLKLKLNSVWVTWAGWFLLFCIDEVGGFLL